MIVNYEQDNTIEGTYLIIEEIEFKNKPNIVINLPDDFFINNSNYKNWYVGWGKQIPLYDAGVENLRKIEKINVSKGVISLGDILRGNGYPEKGQSIVFWNIRPSGFYNYIKKPIINPDLWNNFNGKKVHFSSIEYDSILNSWVMIFNEVSRTQIQIYAAKSENLVEWYPANNGNPILTPADFETGIWTGKDKTGIYPQTPYTSDIIRFKNQWYLFFHGYGNDDKRHIGVAVSDSTLSGTFDIKPQPVLSPGKGQSWDNKSCFYPKVSQYKDGFIMFYDGRNNKGHERVGMAKSTDLLNWDKSAYNPVIDQNTGWRSKKGVAETSHIHIKNDSIFLIIAGAKKFKMGPWHHYITRRMYLDKSGNVDDAQLGIYLSTNGGKSFIAHKNNPVFTNDYSNVQENEHIGANFKLIETDTAKVIIYQAKSSFEGEKYNILIREKK